MSNSDFTTETTAILDALASAYRRGCSDTIARLMAGMPSLTAPPAQPVMPTLAIPPAYFPPRSWAPAEDDLVRREWGKSPVDEIASVVNRTGAAVRLRAAKLGLPRLPRHSTLKEKSR